MMMKVVGYTEENKRERHHNQNKKPDLQSG